MFRVFASLTQTLIPGVVLRQDKGGSNQKPNLQEKRSNEEKRADASREDEVNRRRVRKHLAKMNELARRKERSAKS